MVDLSDDIVSTLEVPITVSAPWSEDPKINHVQVDVEYLPGLADDVDARQSFTFSQSGDGEEHQTFFARRRAGEQLFRVRASVFIEGAAEPFEIEETLQRRTAINIQVPRLGKFELEAEAAPSIFAASGDSKITSVQVDYSYKDPDEPDHVEGTVMLRPDDTEEGQEFTEQISEITNRLIDAPVYLTPTYFRKQQPSITGMTKAVWLGADNSGRYNVPDPYGDWLNVDASAFELAGSGLKKVEVDIKYEDPDSDFASRGEIYLTPQSDWEGSTSLPQVDGEVQAYQYRYTAVAEGQIVRSPWMDASGDGPIPPLPLMLVELHTERLGLGEDLSHAVIRMAYADPENALESSQEFFLTGDESENPIWVVPRVNSSVDSYTYSMELVPKEGEPIRVEHVEASGGHLLLERPDA